MTDAASLQELAEETAEEHRLTGLVIGVLDGDETTVAATGWANRDAAIEATPDGIHQIGSITKVYVTTMVMRLVADGALMLEDPLTGHLPELRLGGDPDLSEVRIRHLLTHTSGIPGDAFFDTGADPEALERWVAAMSTVPVEAPPGNRWSYCNAGFVLLGRIIEKRTGLTFRRAMRELITRPLGVRTPVVTAADALRFRAAVGHVALPDGGSRSTAWVVLPPSNAPAGSLPAARAADVLAFARAHLEPADERLAPRPLLDAMRDHHADQPEDEGAGMGLGWFRLRGEPLVVGHAGSTLVQHAQLVASPSHRLATIVFTNDVHGADVVRTVSRRLWGELAGVDGLLPEPVAVEPVPDIDVAPLEGTYACLGNRADVQVLNGELRVRLLTILPGDEIAIDLEDIRPMSTDGHRWVGVNRLTGGATTLDFRAWRDGRPTVLHAGGRSHDRKD